MQSWILNCAWKVNRSINLKRNSTLFLEKSKIFFEKLLKVCFQKKRDSKRKNFWNFEKFWQFCEGNVDFFFQNYRFFEFSDTV